MMEIPLIFSGLFVGKEGPMIHSGAIIGVGFSQFRSMLIKFKLPYNFFRTDRYIIVICKYLYIIVFPCFHSEISVILLHVELLLEWQLPLGLPLEE